MAIFGDCLLQDPLFISLQPHGSIDSPASAFPVALSSPAVPPGSHIYLDGGTTSCKLSGTGSPLGRGCPGEPALHE